MKRATIRIADDVEAALEAYRRSQETPPVLDSVVQAALREYLARRGFSPPAHPLRIAPARKGSGRRDASVRHDDYFVRE